MGFATVSLRLDEHWIWDTWYAVDGQLAHAFFLYAPRSLGDPNLRHWHARIGHAVSRDLRSWELRPEALGLGRPGTFDDQATWTGSVLRHEGRWLLFYTGLRKGDGPRQRIGLAVSEDLETWTRTDLVLEADDRWYEKATQSDEEHWRDPWAFVGPDGAIHLLITARAKDGPPDGRGVIAHAWSHDLASWEVGPPLSTPGELAQLEVPQLLNLGKQWAVVFSTRAVDDSAAGRSRQTSAPETGTHYLVGDSPLGPFSLAPGPFPLGDAEGRYYGGRIVDWRGERFLLAWIDRVDGSFVGELSDPIAIEFTDGLHLQLASI